MSPPSALDVLAYMGWPQNDPPLAAQAETHRVAVWRQIVAYTRGRGMTAQGYPTPITVPEDMASVLLSATARSLANPTQTRRVEAGSFSELPGSLASFSLLETLTLNKYRRRAA